MKKKATNITKKAGNVPTGFTLWLVCNLWQRELRKALQPLDLTHAQYILLNAACDLGSEKTDITQVILANATGTDKMMVSKILRTLEGKKLLKRAGLKTDNRAKSITVTARGMELCQKASEVVDSFEKTFFTPAAKNLKSFQKSLGKILRNYDE
ncbi:MAG TPA: MarR family transcriptional regulator [Bacteroidia bacterium]|nr:MarR family transcriptional regulator [Bacteroidia bacterium]